MADDMANIHIVLIEFSIYALTAGLAFCAPHARNKLRFHRISMMLYIHEPLRATEETNP
jgi:hypothetical protein